MKNVVRLLSLSGLLILLGCNSSSAYKEQVDALNSKWDAATEEVTQFSEKASNELETWETMYEGMYGSEGSANADIPEEKREKLDSLDAVCKGHGDKYRIISQQLSELKTSWEQNSKVVEEINERLENNTLAEEQLTIIKQLEQQAEKAGQEIASWNSEMEAVKESCAATCREFAQIKDGE